MRLWWTVGGCEIEAPVGEGPGLHLRVDDTGRLTSTALDRPSESAEEEPFAGLANRLEIDAALLRPELLDAVRTPQGHHIVLLNERGKATLDGALWPGAITLDTKGAKSPTWPKKLIWKKKAPRSRTRKMSAERGQILLHAHGDAIAVTCRYTGIVALFRGGSMSPSLLRMPLEPGLRLRASATARGALVAVSKASGRGAIIHYADDGAILGKRPLTGLLRALPTSESRALLLTHGEGEASAHLHLIDLATPSLADLPQGASSLDLGFAATALAIDDDGRFAATDGVTLRRGRIADDSLSLDEALDLRGDRPTSEADGERPSANTDGGSDQSADDVSDQSADIVSDQSTDDGESSSVNDDRVNESADESADDDAAANREESKVDADPTRDHAPAEEDRDEHVTVGAAPDASADPRSHVDPKPEATALVGTPPPASDTDTSPAAPDEGGPANEEVTDPAPETVSDPERERPGAEETGADPDDDSEAGPSAAAESPPPPTAALLEGAPALGLGIGGTPTRGWGGEAAHSFTITLRLRSLGRGAAGLELEVGGEALTRGLIQLIEVVADGHSGAFVPSEAGMRRATLPELAIPPGVEHDDDAPPTQALADSHVEVTIRAQAIRRGNGLLALRVGALGSPAAKLRRLRPVTIR